MSINQFDITERDGCYHLTGFLNEYADLEPLKMASEPLRLNFGGIAKLNSIGVRNFLRFLAAWGPREIYYECATTEFIDQVNMIPSMKGMAGQAKILSFYVPWQCMACEHEDEVFTKTSDVQSLLGGEFEPERTCPKCGEGMNLLVESYFDFLAD